jgi:hypothetical protein
MVSKYKCTPLRRGRLAQLDRAKNKANLINSTKSNIPTSDEVKHYHVEQPRKEEQQPMPVNNSVDMDAVKSMVSDLTVNTVKGMLPEVVKNIVDAIASKHEDERKDEQVGLRKTMNNVELDGKTLSTLLGNEGAALFEDCKYKVSMDIQLIS